MTDYPVGARVRAVNFALDEGLRIWPVQNERNMWRVVRVTGQNVEELFRGGSFCCQHAHPDATYSINDNESVPPGTEGTVSLSDQHNLQVEWDNGRHLGVAPGDTIELCASQTIEQQRLECLRLELRAERISYGELLELQNLVDHIEPGDVELLEAAGVPEHPADAEDEAD